MSKKILIIGYGNPGRLDDGLGPAFAEALERMKLENLTVDSNYQLSVEDSAQVAGHDVVIFADAAVKGREPFFFKEISPLSAVSFSSHSVDPENLLALAEQIFHKIPEGYVLGIRGYEFNEFGEWLSEGARKNLADAIAYMTPVIKKQTFNEFIIK